MKKKKFSPIDCAHGKVSLSIKEWNDVESDLLVASGEHGKSLNIKICKSMSQWNQK